MATIFQQSVWDALKKIPKGKVTTYGEIARYLGKPRAVRAVGTAVGKNPNAPRIPCHRVVPTTGKIGNYSGPGGTATKVSLLQKEGVQIEKNKVSDLVGVMYIF